MKPGSRQSSAGTLPPDIRRSNHVHPLILLIKVQTKNLTPET